MNSKIVDWVEVQKFYDDMKSIKETVDHFRVGFSTIVKATKRGQFKSRGRAATAELRRCNKIIKPYTITEECREKRRESMRKAVLEGRQKTPRPWGSKMTIYKATNTAGKEETLHGGWEKIVADYMNANNITWNKVKESFSYEWEGRIHQYFPDFFLADMNIYIEVKGYETDRDRCKWSDFPHKLLVIDKRNIKKLDDFFAAI